MPSTDDHSLAEATARRARDDALLADLTAPPTVEEARDSRDYWQQRLGQLSLLKRTERREAQQMVAAWQRRLDEAERAQYGPGLLTMALDMLGVRWRPNPRRLVAGIAIIAVLAMALLVALIIAIVVFWPELAPIVHLFAGNGGSGGD